MSLSATSATDVHIRSVFNAVDVDGSGGIELDELVEALTQPGARRFPIASARMLFRLHDTNGDGDIDFEEFRKLYSFVLLVQRTFAALDTGAGLTLQLVGKAIEQIGLVCPQTVLAAHFEHFDASETGFLAYDEFLQLAVQLRYVNHVFDLHDTGNIGRIVIDRAGLLALGLWLR